MKDLLEIKDTLQAARSLLGSVLVHVLPEGKVSGLVVETEAYRSKDDPACHAFRGKTKRNYVMFGPAGSAYVYFIYGNHYCFNIVTGDEGSGEAVLVRALEPLDGIGLMRERRGINQKIINLTNGPGKLCAAMSISTEHNGMGLLNSPLYLSRGIQISNDMIGNSTRIGIKNAREKQWRFFIKGNPFVSR